MFSFYIFFNICKLFVVGISIILGYNIIQGFIHSVIILPKACINIYIIYATLDEHLYFSYLRYL